MKGGAEPQGRRGEHEEPDQGHPSPMGRSTLRDSGPPTGSASEVPGPTRRAQLSCTRRPSEMGPDSATRCALVTMRA